MKPFSWIALGLVVLSADASSQQTKPPPPPNPATRPTTTAPLATAMGGVYSRGSQLIGREIVTPAGERLGRIEELIIDGDDGRLAYVAVSFEPLTGGTTNRLWVVPWDMLVAQDSYATGVTGRSTPVRTYVLDVARERIASAPGFSRPDWPVLDRAWASRVYGYFGRTPHWDRPGRVPEIEEELRARAEGDPPRRPTPVDPHRTDRDVPPLDRTDPFPVGMFEARNMKDARGTITSIIEQEGLENDLGVGVRLLVKRDDQAAKEQDVLVFVGPTDFVRKQGFSFSQNDRVTLRGAEMDRDGRRVFVATEIVLGDRTLLLRRENGVPVWRRKVRVTGEN